MNNKLKEYKVTIKASILLDDPQILDQLVIGKMVDCGFGLAQCVVVKDEDFKVLEYEDNWLDFEEVIK